MHHLLAVAPDPSSIAAMMTLYLNELTPAGPSVYPQLALYWRDPDRMPYLIRVADRDVGFVLVRRHPGTVFHELAEFYVVPAWRRHGIGRVAAQAVFDRYPGWWHLQILDDNTGAQAFWRRVIEGAVHEQRRVAASGRAFTMLQFQRDASGTQ